MADSAAYPDYGLDAPPVVRMLVIGGVLTIAASFVAPAMFRTGLRWTGAFCLVETALMLLSSYNGKLRERDRIIALIPWRGDETVLDVGCGRGLLLIAAAQQLGAGGKAVGIDVWRSADLSDNWAEATWDNARAEGVEDRIEIHDADARTLPFADAFFDVVLSSLAIHNMSRATDRRQAIEEMARVLKPGGRIVILDIQATKLYAERLRGQGMKDVQRSRLRFRTFPPSRLVTAIK